ncbi:MAG: endolytic transglycosylase MltG [Acetanaerobacterium sp.]
MKQCILKTIAAIFAALLLLTGCGNAEESDTRSEDVVSKGVYSSSSQQESGDGSETDVVSEGAAAGDVPGSQLPGDETDASSEAPLTLSITIPEGYTLARIGMLLEEKDICTADEFIAASENGDFSDFSLIAAQESGANRCFDLEGYLFPDTYEIYLSDPPDTIIRRMLQHTEQKFNDSLRGRISDSGYTVDEIITLASIIEKEAFGHESMPYISSVLHNRLDSGMRLQCDVTINYVEGAIKPFITGDINRYNSDYNTYKCDALPAGAICNPSLDAINAALSPEDTNYFYFVTDADGRYYYAETWEEHLQNVEEAGIDVPE